MCNVSIQAARESPHRLLVCVHVFAIPARLAMFHTKLLFQDALDIALQALKEGCDCQLQRCVVDYNCVTGRRLYCVHYVGVSSLAFCPWRNTFAQFVND